MDFRHRRCSHATFFVDLLSLPHIQDALACFAVRSASFPLSLVTRHSSLATHHSLLLGPSGALAMGILLVYAEFMLQEKDFQRKADAAFDNLKRRLLALGDEHGFDVEGEAGKLEVVFEEPEEAKFVISPNTPVREIWISALSTSFKLGWNDSRSAFVLEKTGEDLYAVMSRVISQQLGTQVTL